MLIIAGTLDYAHNLRKRITWPSDHDKKFYGAALGRLPPNGTVIDWLKRAEMTEASIADFPTDVLGALEKTIKFSRTQPVGSDDTRIAGSFESLTGAITSFCQSVDSWTFVVYARQFKGIAAPPSGTSQSGTSQSGTPPSGKSQPPISPRAFDANMKEETVALTRRHDDLIRAYDRFIRTAHARGIDIDG